MAGQQAFKFPKVEPKKTWGGRRKGAGQKSRFAKARVGHGPRAIVKPWTPVHVTLRMKSDVPRLRNFERAKVLRAAFVKGCNKGAFRICQFSIQGNHIHLICEASDRYKLSRGMQGFEIRVARGLNRLVEREGAVFDDRYHVEVIKTPRHMRNTLCYVLQNARRHGERLPDDFHGADPYSSARHFDGWSSAWQDGIPPPPDDAMPVAEPRSHLLRVLWRKRGLIGVTEVPAAGLRP